jgi:hypothetical protein
LSGIDVTSWDLRPYRRLLAPKNRFGFRSVTQLDPYDFFIYTALVYEAGIDIEASRLPKADEIAISYRFLPDATGTFFDLDFDWSRFHDRSEELLQRADVTHVVVTDIADFFPRIYSHPLENALTEALSARPLHANALKRFLKQLNQNISYGIPTGPDASFLLSELLLDVIDRGLLSESVVHCRWADDFRLFCQSERDAYDKLNTLAQMLFETYGLTLQQGKTRILTADEFLNRLDRETNAEVERLSTQFDDILDELGIEGGWYEPISLDDLDSEQREQLDALNLVGVLEEEIEAENGFSQPVFRFVMWRLTQLNNPDAIEFLLDKLEHLYPVAPDVLRYAYSVEITDVDQRHRVRDMLINLIDNSVMGDSMYLRNWILAILSKPNMDTGVATFVRLYNALPDEYSQRQCVTGLGRSHATAWIRSRKSAVQTFGPWVRRAFLAAASSLPGDEFENYHRSIKTRLDSLEQVVCDWAKHNPF